MGVERVVNAAKLDSLKSLRSISSIINPEEIEYLPDVYEWKNIKLNKFSRIVELSNKNLKDADLIREIPSISCFNNIREFEIRNNFITALSCRIIANNVSFIHSLDIRGNKIGDTGILYIVKGIPNLKNLFISETGATDKSVRHVAEKMDKLELFWAENNFISGEVAVSLGQKPKVKVMSVAGNNI